MCDAKEFALATVDGGFYYSPTFKEDKFIHATADPQFLLEAGNHFYKVPEIRCLEFDATCVYSLGWKLIRSASAVSHRKLYFPLCCTPIAELGAIESKSYMLLCRY